ncbi:Aspartate ammonia-lyase [Pantoea agglomerans]|uniref:Aspartate ammonia-lyase n=1 Tax=Enterobacter agglomerans TaxID=549 RepID=A0A379ANF4_ENTAG|nr:Aspartate ammonia-lyase [Pantoea agglomerans]
MIGNDITVTMASEAGQLQLNVMEPVIGQALFESISILTNACYNLLEKCINGITANRAVVRSLCLQLDWYRDLPQPLHRPPQRRHRR